MDSLETTFHGGWNYRPAGIVPQKRNRNVKRGDRGMRLRLARSLSSDIVFRTNCWADKLSGRKSWRNFPSILIPENIFIYILYVDPCSNISFLIFNTGFMHFTYRGFVSVFPRRGKNRSWLAAIPPYTSVAIYLHYESPEERRQRATRAILIFPKYPPYFFHPPHQPIQLVRSTL